MPGGALLEKDKKKDSQGAAGAAWAWHFVSFGLPPPCVAGFNSRKPHKKANQETK
jgi:hypothetical protein